VGEHWVNWSVAIGGVVILCAALPIRGWRTVTRNSGTYIILLISLANVADAAPSLRRPPLNRVFLAIGLVIFGYGAYLLLREGYAKKKQS
jgi:hypothetical protein